MYAAPTPEILPPGTRRTSPRIKRASGLVDDENLDLLSHLLDDFIHIPGTSIRLGLDGIIGFVPGIGDIVGGVASCIIIVAAWLRGVPYPVIARMVANVGIEVAVGTVPLLGDIFDIAWKANRRNYHLLTGSLEAPRKHTTQSWLFLFLLCAGLMALVLIPTLLLAWMLSHLFHATGSAP